MYIIYIINTYDFNKHERDREWYKHKDNATVMYMYQNYIAGFVGKCGKYEMNCITFHRTGLIYNQNTFLYKYRNLKAFSAKFLFKS